MLSGASSASVECNDFENYVDILRKKSLGYNLYEYRIRSEMEGGRNIVSASNEYVRRWKEGERDGWK